MAPSLPLSGSAWRSFERSVYDEMILLAPFSPAIFKKADYLLEGCQAKIALRSLDALHLAACDHLQDWPLATIDQRMRAAGALLRFPLTELPGSG